MYVPLISSNEDSLTHFAVCKGTVGTALVIIIVKMRLSKPPLTTIGTDTIVTKSPKFLMPVSLVG
jgi:hypothetical protein